MSHNAFSTADKSFILYTGRNYQGPQPSKVYTRRIYPPRAQRKTPEDEFLEAMRGIESSLAMAEMEIQSSTSGRGGGYRESDGIYTAPPLQIPLYAHLDFVTYMFSRRLGSPEVANKLALVDAKSGESLTCSEMRNAIEAVASGLHGIGIEQGDVVMVLLANALYFPVIFNAALKIGAVVTTMNPLNTEREIARQMKDSNPKLIFTTWAGIDKVRNLGLPLVLLGEEEDRADFFSGGVNSIPFSQLLAADPSKAPVVRIRQSDTAALLYSSGTTGLSKGVVISHGNLIATMAAAENIPEEMHEKDVILVLFPMYHIGGLVWLACGAIFGGPSLVLLPKYDLLDLLVAIEKYRVTKITGAPPVALDMLKNPVTSNYDLSSLKALICAAAPLGKDSMQAVVAKFPHVTTFIQLYGMTETTTVGSGGMGPMGSAGTLKPGLEAKVVDLQTRKPLPPNSRGELWLRGPSIMQGYLNNPVATDEAIDKEGWLHTGDLVYFDNNGYLYIVDRLKELIKYKGYQVAPAELEALLLTHPSIIDCAVVPFQDEAAGEIPLAYIVRNPQKSLSSKEVVDFISSQVSPYKKIRRVAFLDAIPKSQSGKILRKELKQLALARL